MIISIKLKNIKSKLLILIVLAFLFTFCGNKESKTVQSSEEHVVDSALTIKKLTELIRKNPFDANLYNERAKLNIRQSRIEDAINDLEIAYKIDSLNPEYFIQLSDLYLKNGNSDKTKEILDRFLKYNPKNVYAMHRLANLYFYVKEYTKAMEWLNKTQEVDRNFAQIYYTKGMIYKETGDTNMSIRNFQVAVEKEPEYYDAYIWLGLLYAEKRDSIAIAYYENAIQIIPSSIEAHYNLAMYFQQNNYENKALNEYNLILTEIDSLQPNIYFNIGYIYMQYLNEYKRAITKFTHAVRLNKSFVQAYYNRGFCFERLRDFEKAEKDYQKSLEIVGNYDLAIQGLNRLDKIKN